MDLSDKRRLKNVNLNLDEAELRVERTTKQPQKSRPIVIWSKPNYFQCPFVVVIIIVVVVVLCLLLSLSGDNC